MTIAVVLGVINLLGAKKSGGLQVALVFGLLSLLLVFVTSGAFFMQPLHFEGFLAAGFDNILSTAGLVYISYVGVTKVASLSEEVKNPERNLPRAVFLALASAILVYGLGTTVIVGLVPPDELRGNLTPVATAAGYALGFPGVVLLSLAALLAFVSVANAGMLSASRYPLAMSRDHLLPDLFRKLSRFGTPFHAISATSATIILIIVLFDPVAHRQAGQLLSAADVRSGLCSGDRHAREPDLSLTTRVIVLRYTPGCSWPVLSCRFS